MLIENTAREVATTRLAARAGRSGSAARSPLRRFQPRRAAQRPLQQTSALAVSFAQPWTNDSQDRQHVLDSPVLMFLGVAGLYAVLTVLICHAGLLEQRGISATTAVAHAFQGFRIASPLSGGGSHVPVSFGNLSYGNVADCLR